MRSRIFTPEAFECLLGRDFVRKINIDIIKKDMKNTKKNLFSKLRKPILFYITMIIDKQIEFKYQAETFLS